MSTTIRRVSAVGVALALTAGALLATQVALPTGAAHAGAATTVAATAQARIPVRVLKKYHLTNMDGLHLQSEVGGQVYFYNGRQPRMRITANLFGFSEGTHCLQLTGFTRINKRGSRQALMEPVCGRSLKTITITPVISPKRFGSVEVFLFSEAKDGRTFQANKVINNN